MDKIHCIESNQRHVQPQIYVCHLFAKEEGATVRENLVSLVKSSEQIDIGFIKGLLCCGETTLVYTVIDIIIYPFVGTFDLFC